MILQRREIQDAKLKKFKNKNENLSLKLKTKAEKYNLLLPYLFV